MPTLLSLCCLFLQVGPWCSTSFTWILLILLFWPWVIWELLLPLDLNSSGAGCWDRRVLSCFLTWELCCGDHLARREVFFVAKEVSSESLLVCSVLMDLGVPCVCGSFVKEFLMCVSCSCWEPVALAWLAQVCWQSHDDTEGHGPTLTLALHPAYGLCDEATVLLHFVKLWCWSDLGSLKSMCLNSAALWAAVGLLPQRGLTLFSVALWLHPGSSVPLCVANWSAEILCWKLVYDVCKKTWLKFLEMRGVEDSVRGFRLSYSVDADVLRLPSLLFLLFLKDKEGLRGPRAGPFRV